MSSFQKTPASHWRANAYSALRFDQINIGTFAFSFSDTCQMTIKIGSGTYAKAITSWEQILIKNSFVWKVFVAKETQEVFATPLVASRLVYFTSRQKQVTCLELLYPLLLSLPSPTPTVCTDDRFPISIAIEAPLGVPSNEPQEPCCETRLRSLWVAFWTSGVKGDIGKVMDIKVLQHRRLGT